MKQKVVIALGVFDGVHRGHQKIVRELKQLALRTGCKPLVVNFEPHPLVVLAPSKAPKRLSQVSDKRALLEGLGDIGVDEIAFTDDVAHMDGQAFWSYLKDRYHLFGVVVGFNFHFGAGAKWGGSDLQQMANDDRIICEIVPAYVVDGEPISSTRVRKNIAEGEIEQANKLLGYPYALQGHVVTGKGLGRKISFPTANVVIPKDMQVPKQGTYITKTKIQDTWHPSMTNIGNNPTVEDESSLKIESHILNFCNDIYNQTIDVAFFKRIRDEEKFATVDELKGQLEKDREAVQEFFDK